MIVRDQFVCQYPLLCVRRCYLEYLFCRHPIEISVLLDYLKLLSIILHCLCRDNHRCHLIMLRVFPRRCHEMFSFHSARIERILLRCLVLPSLVFLRLNPSIHRSTKKKINEIGSRRISSLISTASRFSLSRRIFANSDRRRSSIDTWASKTRVGLRENE